MKVCMLVRNAFELDARVERAARALMRRGDVVTVVAIWEPGRTARREVRDGIRIRRVSRRHFGVDLLTRRGPDPEPGESRRGARAGGAAPGREAARRRAGPGALAVLVLRRLLNLLPPGLLRFAIEIRMALAALRERPDVVHANDLNTLRAAVWVGRAARARLVYDSHEIWPGIVGISDAERGRWQRLERRLIRSADAVIHTTPMRARWAAQAYGIPTPVVVRNVPERSDAVAPVDLAAAAGFPAGSRVILHQGTMNPHRGLEALVEAMGALEDGYGLLLLGRGRLQPALEEAIGRLGLAARVRLLPPVPHADLLAWTAGAWCGASLLVDVCLNHRYSLPNKLFEYLAVGVPLIASGNPEIAEFVAAHGVGEICDPRDAASVAAAVRRLAARHEEAAAAARAAGAKLRWEDEEAKLLDVYRGLPA